MQGTGRYSQSRITFWQDRYGGVANSFPITRVVSAFTSPLWMKRGTVLGSSGS